MSNSARLPLRSGALGPVRDQGSPDAPGVEAAVGALPAEVAGLAVDQAERPLIELVVLAARREVAGAGEVMRHAVGLEGDTREGVAQPLLDQADGEVRGVDADPRSPELLRRVHGGAAAAERIA